jgi:hypothetical protein
MPIHSAAIIPFTHQAISLNLHFLHLKKKLPVKVHVQNMNAQTFSEILLNTSYVHEQIQLLEKLGG